MITKFLRKRNVNSNLPFANPTARIQAHLNGSHTFQFKKIALTSPVSGNILNTEAGSKMTNELSQYLIAD